MGYVKSGLPLPAATILIAVALTSIDLIVRMRCALKSLDKFL